MGTTATLISDSVSKDRDLAFVVSTWLSSVPSSTALLQCLLQNMADLMQIAAKAASALMKSTQPTTSKN
jgi:hypothetical protein